MPEMKETLSNLHSVAGLEGVILCDKDGQVLEASFSREAERSLYAKIGYAFSLGIQSQKQKPQAIYGTFRDGRIAVRIFETGFIIIVGKLSMRQLLLKAALDRALKGLEKIALSEKKHPGEKDLQVIAGKIRSDQAVLDQNVVDDWKKLVKSGTVVRQVEIKTSIGKSRVFRIKTKKGLGDSVELNNSALKELDLAEGETVKACPLVEMASEVDEFFG